MKTNKFKSIMNIYGITYADIGKKVNRSPSTVKQRLDSETTFHKHYDQYKRALDDCILEKEKEKEKAKIMLNKI